MTATELIELLHPGQKQPPAEPATKARRAKHDVVHRIQSAALAFQETVRRLGGGVLLPSVELYLSEEIAPHLLDAHGGAAAGQMFSAAASVTEIAGWMTHDSRQDSRACAYFSRAFRLAVAAENNALAANTCASMAHLAIELGHQRRRRCAR